MCSGTDATHLGSPVTIGEPPVCQAGLEENLMFPSPRCPPRLLLMTSEGIAERWIALVSWAKMATGSSLDIALDLDLVLALLVVLLLLL